MNRQDMLNHIDVKAGAVRASYITDVPGQQITYMLKAEQAQKFASKGFAGAPPSLIAGEAAASGVSARQAAQAILREEELWTQLAAGIEQIRRAGKIAVQSAPSELAAQQAFEQTIDLLVTLFRK